MTEDPGVWADLPPIQELSLLVSVLVLVLVTLAVIVSFRVNGNAPLSVRLALLALLGFAAMRVYSESRVIWGDWADQAGIPATALGIPVLMVLTLEVIIVLGLVAYYWRRWRARRKAVAMAGATDSTDL